MHAHSPRPASPVGLTLDTIRRLGLLLRLEKKILALIASYALAIGLFSLVVPLTVQELVNTFAFAIQPIMVITLVGIMATTLIFIGALKILQSRSAEILNQRLYTRIALALAKALPRFKDETFSPTYVNYFNESEFLLRALVAMLVDLINVTIGGIVGMTILVFYHPYFLAFNAVLLAGFLTGVTVLSQGGLRITMVVNDLHYRTLTWFQAIGHNLLHFKATPSTPLLLRKTDELVHAYIAARKSRSDILHRQLKGSFAWQALGHSGLIGVAGWLLSTGEITLGQFVAAEVIVGTLLVNFETVARRVYALFHVFTSLAELSALLALPKDSAAATLPVPLLDPPAHGLHLSAKAVSFAYPNSPPIFERFNLEVAPGEKVALVVRTSRGKTTLALTLAGLYTPTSGVIKYNGVDLRDLSLDSLNACRGLVLSTHLSLFKGTLEENIALDRASIAYEDLQWALRFVELEDDTEALPVGLQTPVGPGLHRFTTSQILRILLARAIVTRPRLLILDGTLQTLAPDMRERILRRLCSKEEPWSLIVVTNDQASIAQVDRRVELD
ncbi:ATP-binding cassette domain-containing protein [Nitrospira sp. Kam-Ns4a]